MTFETKEQVLERILTHPKPNCPHCNEEMSLWEVPPVNVGDGLGWGTPYLYICFNDNCSCYKEGWDNMKENYAQSASYRSINLKEAIKKGFSILADCYVSQDGPQILQMLLDVTEPVRVRIKAAEMIGDIGELEAIEPIRNVTFGNQILQKNVDDAITKIHQRFFTRECPFCAEIIKKRAKICKYCQKEVAGL
jgi:hypothetical protein